MAKARRLLTAAVQETPHNPEAWLELAGVVEKLAEKKGCFIKVLELDPNHNAARAGLTLVEQKMADQAAALPPVVADTGRAHPETGLTHCYRHPDVETGLRCNRCNKPICPQCAQRTPVGFRCAECIAELENRYYSHAKDTDLNPYDRPLTKPIVSFVVLGLIILIWVAMEIAGGSEDNDVLIAFGANYGPLIMEGQIWRLFTSMFLHIGAQHLAFNFIGVIAFGVEMERIYGRYRYLVIYLLAGLFGNLASFAVSGPAMFSAGASGAIFGVIGMNLAFFLIYRHRMGEYGRQRRKMVLVLVAVSLVLGYTVLPSDNLAHMGGLLGGFVLGYGLTPRYRVDHNSSPRRIIDRASLLRRWWVSTLGLIMLVGGVWLAFTYWSGVQQTRAAEDGPDIKPITYGQTVEDTLAAGDHIGIWVFEGEAGQTVTIAMKSDSLDALLELYGPDKGNFFLTHDDNSGENLNARIKAYRLPDTGHYIIAAISADESFGPYELTLTLEP